MYLVWWSIVLRMSGGQIDCLTMKKPWMLMADVNCAGSLSPQWTSSSPDLLWGILPPPTSEAETGFQQVAFNIYSG